MLSLLRTALERESYVVSCAARGKRALELLRANEYVVISLDVRIPPPDGIEIVQRLRTRGCWTPVMMVSVEGDVGVRVAGIDAGADDYMVKPFAMEEFCARVRALVRRKAIRNAPVLEVADVRLDPHAHRVWRGSSELTLTATEFKLLHVLMENEGQVLSREQLLDRVWDVSHDVRSNVVDVYIRYLRRKLDSSPDASYIETVRGVGYRFGAPRGRVS